MTEQQLTIAGVYLPLELFRELIARIAPNQLDSVNRVNKLFHRLTLERVVRITDRESYKRVCRSGDYFSLVHNKDEYPWEISYNDYEKGLFLATRLGD